MRPYGRNLNGVQLHQHNGEWPVAPNPPALPDQGQSAHVLVADTHLEVLSLCQRVLGRAGFAVQPVSPYECVMETLQYRRFDVLLLDLSTTAPGSLALLEQIRQHSLDIPVVVMVEEPARTVSNEHEHERPRTLDHLAMAVRLGIQGMLVKPLNPLDLRTVVVDVIQKHRRDTHDHWQMMQQLVQTEKLAAVGRLVASVAHEMNNPLQALHSSLNLIGKRSLDEKKRQQYQIMAQKEVERLISVVRRMLDYHRPSVEGMRPVNLNNLLEGVLRLTDQKLRRQQVRVLRDWCPRLPYVFAIGSRLRDVCLHLITNAIESMPHGGVLTIRTYATSGSEYQVKAGVSFTPASSAAGRLIRGPSVVIEISDTGPGIAPDDLPKIFEPFYTTRFNATGLGLSLTYSIVDQFQGELSVSSVEGQGTTFRIHLPVATTNSCQ